MSTTQITLTNLNRHDQFPEVLINLIRVPVVVICELDLRIRYCNVAFRGAYEPHTVDFIRLPINRQNAEQTDSGGLTCLEEILMSDRSPEVEFDAEFTGARPRHVCINMRRIEMDSEQLVLVTIEDITRRKEAECIVMHRQSHLQRTAGNGVAKLDSANQDLQNEIARREQVETALCESEDALLRSREELRHLSASLLNAQEEERRRVSRELHDDLSQKVAKLQFDAEILEQQLPFEDIPAAKRRLRDVGQQAAVVSEDLRRVAHQLHPATLDHLGLAIAMRSYMEEFTRSTAIRVRFTGIFVPPDIPIEISAGLFRIMQEALRNVAKHTSNAEVQIVLAGVPGALALYVRDNGPGFDLGTARAKGGLGLISMEERVRLMGGTLELDTQPGKGVFLFIRCPLPGGKS